MRVPETGKVVSFSIQTVTLKNGARLGISPMPGRYGEGLADLSGIAKWHADVVISMTEAIEMERHNIADLDALLETFGIDWVQFPISDFGIPPNGSNWGDVSARLHAVLDKKGAILAHCYGGQGRSGAVLLRLMVERGYDAEHALEMLRRVRPGAVETEGQYQWAANLE